MSLWLIITIAMGVVGVCATIGGARMLKSRSEQFDVDYARNRDDAEIRYLIKTPQSNYGPAILLMFAGILLCFAVVISLVVNLPG